MPLAVTFADLRDHVALHLGLDLSVPVNADRVDKIINRGLRSFYYLRDGAGEGGYHCWSFLNRQFADLSATSGQATIALPSDFSRLQEGVSYGVGAEQAPLGVVKEYEIRNLQSQKAASGPPKYCAVRATSTGEYQLLLYPTPDATYQLIGRYMVEPSAVFDDGSPLGGALHSETILAACLAAAEATLNPEATTEAPEPSTAAGTFARLLQSSIEADKTIDAANAEAGTWPLDADATDDLSVTKRYLRRLIGRHLNHGPAPENWTHGQRSEVAEALRTGLRKFYNPSMPGERSVHLWSFLRPRKTFSLLADKHTYDLPEDFAVLEGPGVYIEGDNLLYECIELVGEHQLEQWLQNQTTSYRPERCAVRVKDTFEMDVGTRWEIIFAPIPDDAYQVQLRYRINPMGTKEDGSLPFGGQPHAQTIIESCLLAADELNGATGRALAERNERFLLRLQTSIKHDQEAHSPDTLGYNRDGSDRLGYSWDQRFMDSHGYDENIVKYNGVTY